MINRTHVLLLALAAWAIGFQSGFSAESTLGDRVQALSIQRGNLSVLMRDNALSPGVLSGVDSLFWRKDGLDFDAFDPDDRGASAGLNFEHVICGHPNPANSFTPRKGGIRI